MDEDILYIAADYEAQKFCGKNVQVNKLLMKHFVYSCLLSDRVVIPAGCFFESANTTNLVETYRLLFMPQENTRSIAELAIGEDRRSFRDDIRIKASWFPKSYSVTDSEQMSLLVHKLDDIEPTNRMGKMRTRLTDNILLDVNENGRSFQSIQKGSGLSSEDTATLVKPLEIMVTEQKHALLPPYIRMEMEKQRALLNKAMQKRWLDYVLFKNYVISCEQAYHAYCNNPLSVFYGEHFRSVYSFKVDYRDTMLFEQFLKLFPIRELNNIKKMDSQDILRAKCHPYVKHYIQCYKAVVERIKESLSIFIVGQNYEKIGEAIDREYKEERKVMMRQVAVDNSEEAIALYRAFKNAFFFAKRRKKAFNSWLKNNSSLELPMIRIMEVLDDDVYGILPNFIHELASVLKQRHKEDKAMNSSGKHYLHTVPKLSEEEKVSTKRFAVALSFPGEYRSFVREVADALVSEFGRESILYDQYHEAEFARINLDIHLQQLYREESELIVVFLCEKYNEKEWCGMEWRAIRTIMNDKHMRNRVMLIRLDAGNVVGVFDTVDGWIDAENKCPQEVAAYILERYKINKAEEAKQRC